MILYLTIDLDIPTILINVDLMCWATFGFILALFITIMKKKIVNGVLCALIRVNSTEMTIMGTEMMGQLGDDQKRCSSPPLNTKRAELHSKFNRTRLHMWELAWTNPNNYEYHKYANQFYLLAQAPSASNVNRSSVSHMKNHQKWSVDAWSSLFS